MRYLRQGTGPGPRSMICPFCQSENDRAAATCARCGRGLGPAPPIAPGAVVASRYEILSQLGAGGMGLVFKAYDRRLDETVALKIVRAGGKPDPELASRFRSEVKLAWKVRHKNVCGVREYGEDGELLFFTMELVEGRDLKQLLRDRGGLDWEEAYEVALQVAAGLEAIHEAGIIHRDLKTSNVMRDRHGVVRLMDFGIAKVGEPEGSGGITGAFAVASSLESTSSEPAPTRSSGITGTGQVMGSPEYMSPEQVQCRTVDFRSDIYALGVMIYEVFTGRVPFRGDTPVATMRKHVEEPPPLAGPEAAAIPEALLPVLRKALAKDPGERHARCRELIVALERARAALEGRVTETVSPAARGAASIPGGGRPAASLGPPSPLPAEARYLVPKLADGLRHHDAEVRTRAAGMLARLGADAKAAIPALVAALDDEAAAVRAAASAALGRLAPDEAAAVDSKPATPPSHEEPFDVLAAPQEESRARPTVRTLEPVSSPSNGPSEEPPHEHGIRARIRLAVVALLALVVVTAAVWRFCATHLSGPSGPAAPAVSKTE